MKVSTKGRYALRLMTDIADQGGEGFVSLKDAAERQGISMKYLEQIAGMLAKAGLLQSGRGAQGGYRLTRSPEEYTVGDILRLTEGTLAPVACIECNGESNCERSIDCPTLPLWQKLDSIIEEYLDSLSLADLINKNL